MNTLDFGAQPRNFSDMLPASTLLRCINRDSEGGLKPPGALPISTWAFCKEHEKLCCVITRFTAAADSAKRDTSRTAFFLRERQLISEHFNS